MFYFRVQLYANCTLMLHVDNVGEAFVWYVRTIHICNICSLQEEDFEKKKRFSLERHSHDGWPTIVGVPFQWKTFFFKVPVVANLIIFLMPLPVWPPWPLWSLPWLEVQYRCYSNGEVFFIPPTLIFYKYLSSGLLLTYCKHKSMFDALLWLRS